MNTKWIEAQEQMKKSISILSHIRRTQNGLKIKNKDKNQTPSPTDKMTQNGLKV
jgi:hypothetical protein